MKTRKMIVEFIVFILVLNFFYEGIYKLVYLTNYSLWLHHAPLLKPLAGVLLFMVPFGVIILSIALIVPSFRGTALHITIIILISFVLWIMSVYLFTHRLFWPYHALWAKPTWMQKILISLGLSWLALIAIILSETTLNITNIKNVLRKMPANAQ